MESKVGLFCVGAQKSGTTALYETLRDTAEFSCSVSRKELDYFSINYSRGFDWYHSWYDADGEGVKIDISPSYLASPITPGRILDYNPDARVLFLVRSPILRLLSAYQHYVRVTGRRLSMSSYLSRSPFSLLDGGYADSIKRYRFIFGEKSVFVVPFEDLVADTREALREVCESVRVSPISVPSTLTKANAGFLPASPRTYAAARRFGGLLRSMRADALVEYVKKKKIDRLLFSSSSNSLARPVVRREDVVSIVKIVELEIAVAAEYVRDAVVEVWREDLESFLVEYGSP